jgi:hypothetical protein
VSLLTPPTSESVHRAWVSRVNEEVPA